MKTRPSAATAGFLCPTEPCVGEIAVGGARPNIRNGRNWFQTELHERPRLHSFGLPRVMQRESLERLVERQQFRVTHLRRGDVESRGAGAQFFQPPRPAAPPAGAARARSRFVAGPPRPRTKLRPAFPQWLHFAAEPQPRLVHQRRRLQRVPGACRAIFAAASLRCSPSTSGKLCSGADASPSWARCKRTARSPRAGVSRWGASLMGSGAGTGLDQSRTVNAQVPPRPQRAVGPPASTPNAAARSTSRPARTSATVRGTGTSGSSPLPSSRRPFGVT